MDHFISQANVDHYLNLLNGDLSISNRHTIARLLVKEEDKLGADLQHLEFAETRATSGRERVNKLRNLRDGFGFGTPERAQADSLLIICENTQTLLEDFCHRMREMISRGGI